MDSAAYYIVASCPVPALNSMEGIGGMEPTQVPASPAFPKG